MSSSSLQVCSRSTASTLSDEESEYHVTYTVRDVLLYAAAVGFGSVHNNNHDMYQDSDLPFVWEDHDEIRVLPTWACCLPFWATTHRPNTMDSSNSLPSFPPPTMKTLLPRNCLRSDDDADAVTDSQLSDYPILHTRQCFQWNHHHRLPQGKPLIKIQGSYRLRQRFVQVLPKTVGTFVTTQTQVLDDDDDSGSIVVCTMQSTALILGLDASLVRPWNDASVPLLHFPKPHPARDYFIHQSPEYTERIHITSQTTLFYRLASGDTNAIHVNPKANPLGDGTQCVLH
eukprot:scaffold1048_cov90-Amphora_coffeaeformis.AAC.27